MIFSEINFWIEVKMYNKIKQHIALRKQIMDKVNNSVFTLFVE